MSAIFSFNKCSVLANSFYLGCLLSAGKRKLDDFFSLHTEPQYSEGLFPQFFFAAWPDNNCVRVSRNFLLSEFFLLDSLVVNALVSSKNCIYPSWWTRAMIISSISSSRFCAGVVLTIWNIHGSKSKLSNSRKKELYSQLATGFSISAHLASICLIDSQYLAMVLKSDWIWHIIWDTTLFLLARSEAWYCLFKVFHISFCSITPFIQTPGLSIQFKRIMEYANEYSLSQSKSLSLFFSIFASFASLISSLMVMPQWFHHRPKLKPISLYGMLMVQSVRFLYWS